MLRRFSTKFCLRWKKPNLRSPVSPCPPRGLGGLKYSNLREDLLVPDEFEFISCLPERWLNFFEYTKLCIVIHLILMISHNFLNKCLFSSKNWTSLKMNAFENIYWSWIWGTIWNKTEEKHDRGKVRRKREGKNDENIKESTQIQ